MSKQNQEQAIIEVSQLSKTYSDGRRQVNVLNDLQMSVYSGELLAIIGQSGSGKSTLLHVIGGLDEPTSGEVLIGGENIHQMSAKQQGLFRNRHLGFVYQFHHLLPEFTALENVCMPAYISGQSGNQVTEKAKELLQELDSFWYNLAN